MNIEHTDNNVQCDHDGGTLLPYNGTWTGAVEGDESTRTLYCFGCGDAFEVKRRNISVEKVGNLHEDR